MPSLCEKLGVLNACSIVNKALIQDSLCNGALDILVVNKTWIIPDTAALQTASLQMVSSPPINIAAPPPTIEGAAMQSFIVRG